MIKNSKAITPLPTCHVLPGRSHLLNRAAARNIAYRPIKLPPGGGANIGFVGSVLLSGALADTYQKPKNLRSRQPFVSLFLLYLLPERFILGQPGADAAVWGRNGGLRGWPMRCCWICIPTGPACISTLITFL